MAEKGTTILDIAGGTSIATRDANAVDEGSAARVIQRFTPATIHIPTPLGLPHRAEITAIDPLPADLDNLPAELLANLVSCVECDRVVVFGKCLGGTASTSLRVTPIFFDNDAPPGIVGMGEEEMIYEDNLLFTFNGGASSLLETRVFETWGAAKAGPYITDLTLGGATHIDIWMFAI